MVKGKGFEVVEGEGEECRGGEEGSKTAVVAMEAGGDRGYQI